MTGTLPTAPQCWVRARLLVELGLLTMHLSTCAAPALVSSASRGPSSPFLVAVRSLREYRWRSSVRWPGTMSKESKSLQESGRERKQILHMAHDSTRILTQ